MVKVVYDVLGEEEDLVEGGEEEDEEAGDEGSDDEVDIGEEEPGDEGAVVEDSGVVPQLEVVDFTQNEFDTPSHTEGTYRIPRFEPPSPLPEHVHYTTDKDGHVVRTIGSDGDTPEGLHGHPLFHEVALQVAVPDVMVEGSHAHSQHLEALNAMGMGSMQAAMQAAMQGAELEVVEAEEARANRFVQEDLADDFPAGPHSEQYETEFQIPVSEAMGRRRLDDQIPGRKRRKRDPSPTNAHATEQLTQPPPNYEHFWGEKGGWFRKGKFSKKEDELIREGVTAYLRKNDMPDELREKISAGERDKRIEGLWLELAQLFPNRTVLAVYNHTRRIMSQGNYRGEWTKEECARLSSLVGEHGMDWRTIGNHLNRLPGACRDKWRDLENEGRIKRGRWTPQEKERLTTIVQQMTGEQVPAGNIPWTAVAEKMETRTQSQCRNMWYDYLTPELLKQLNWDMNLDAQLVETIFSGGYEDESEIRWSEMIPGRTGSQCRKRWRTLCRQVPHSMQMSLLQAIDGVREYLRARAERVEDE